MASLTPSQKRACAIRHATEPRILAAATAPFPVYRDTRDTEGQNYLCFVATPENGHYGSAVFGIRIHLPESFPFKSPSIGFIHKVFHSNVDLRSGSICLSTIGADWKPSQRLSFVVTVHLSALLDQPEHSDPLNVEAAHLANNDLETYAATAYETSSQSAVRFLDIGCDRKQLMLPLTDDELARAFKLYGANPNHLEVVEPEDNDDVIRNLAKQVACTFQAKRRRLDLRTSGDADAVPPPAAGAGAGGASAADD